MGLFPAILNLPVSLTQTEDASVGAVKNARGTLVGWTLPEAATARLGTVTDQEVVLEQRPTQLLIKLKKPIAGFSSEFGEGVCIYLFPKCRQRKNKINQETYIFIQYVRKVSTA